jgi:hypothetical protein
MTTLAGRTGVTHASPGRSGGGNRADLVGWVRRLSDSAEGVRAAAATPGADAAIAAAIGHIETALENLERGTDEMEALARARLTRATVLLGDPWNDVVVARTAHDFQDLARALANARRACEKLGRSVGPVLAELGGLITTDACRRFWVPMPISVAPAPADDGGHD